MSNGSGYWIWERFRRDSSRDKSSRRCSFDPRFASSIYIGGDCWTRESRMDYLGKYKARHMIAIEMMLFASCDARRSVTLYNLNPHIHIWFARGKSACETRRRRWLKYWLTTAKMILLYICQLHMHNFRRIWL